jgi:diguanylate cyclase (GGDEF)-like protein/PAS domain S-box-containing protein
VAAKRGTNLPSRTGPARREDAPVPAPSGVRLDASEMMAGMVASTCNALYVLDGRGIVQLWNPAAATLFGWSEAEVIGRRLPILDEVDEAELDRDCRAVMGGAGLAEVETSRRRKDGTEVHLLMTTMPLRDREGEVVAVFTVSQDLTRAKQTEETLRRQAMNDPLTNLLNRRAFLDAVQAELDTPAPGALMVFLDLDDFKDVNDTHGGDIGDTLLRLFSERLRRSLRPDSVIGRLGGDEFGVLLVDVAMSAVPAVVGRLLASTGGPYRVGGRRLVVRATAGVAPVTGVATAEEALRFAHMAMYEAKQSARHRFRVFDETIGQEVAGRFQMAAALEQAMADNELEVFYQPVVSVASGLVVGMEALVRWPRPGGLEIPPDQFVPLAEQTGAIGRLGYWVLDQACTQVSRWSSEDPGRFAHLVLSVNLSPRQLNEPRFVSSVREILARNDLDAGRLQLEVTETALSEDAAAAAVLLGRLRRLGVLLAIDDFGTGNSSLTLLRRMPFSLLKVDQSFVAGIGSNAEDTAIVTATLGLAQALGLVTTAEGVETAEQLAFLRAHGCDQAQGYLLGRPMRAEEFGAQLDGAPLLGAR